MNINKHTGSRLQRRAEEDGFFKIIVPNVYVGGDVAPFPPNLLGGIRRVEHFDHVIKSDDQSSLNWRKNLEHCSI